MSLASLGFGGRALLYAMIALISVRIAVGLPGDAGAQGAFEALADLPLGILALGVLAACLLAFSGWAGLQALHPSSSLALPQRISRGGQALLYAALGILAGKRVLGSGGGGDGTSATSSLMEHPAGRIAIGVVGVTLVGMMCWQLWRAWTDELREDLDHEGGDVPSWGRLVGRLGYAGRGLTLGLVGVFVAHAAITFDASQATGLDAALDELSRTILGRVGVVVIAISNAVLALWFVLVARHGVSDEVAD